MYYTIYKITNQVNGKFYIGSHKTKDLNDNYMGSGKYLKHAQDKYGIEKFTKEILFVFDTPEEMFAKEAEIVNEDFLAEENTYNLKLGGFGGFDYLNGGEFNNPTRTKEHIEMMNRKRIEDYPQGTFYGKTHSPATKEQIINTKRELYGDGVFKTFTGKSHTEDTKKKISEVTKLTSKGSRNSQYGTMWIHSLELQQNKKIKVGEEIPEGWVIGRKIKW